jgi:serine/threonine protein kinase
MLKGEHLERPTYSFLHTLHEGNTAVCVLTEHEIFGCKVVQKTISMLGLGDAAAAVEPELMKRLEHDHIVRVWEAQWEPEPEWKTLNAITFTTPYYEGGSIYTALMDGHRFSVHDTIRIADHVLQALEFMHSGHGILHRDVKPGNVMLDKARRDAFLGDLGSAAYIEKATGGAAGHAGSPLYLAPEARESGIVTVLSDLYSLGVTMVELLQGRFPYEDLDQTMIDSRLDVGRRALAERYFTLEPWVPKPLATFVRSLCNADPEKRPADAATALRALRGLRVVDWKRTDGEGLTGNWIGTWPPELRRSLRRIHEVTVAPVGRGVNIGRVRATARWREPNGKWRNYTRLNTVCDADASAIAAYFRAVEAEAQAAPTR